MRPDSMIREAWLNVTSGTARAFLLACVLCALSTGLVAADALVSVDLVRRAQQFQTSGAAIITVAAPQRIDARVCEALNEIPGITAGAMRPRPDPMELTLLLAAPVAVYETSPSFPDVLRAADRMPGGGAYLSSEVVDALGGDSARPISTSQGSVHVAGVYDYPADGRRTGFGWAALIPVTPADSRFDECWARAWPLEPQLRQLLLTTVIGSPSVDAASGVEVGQVNERFGDSFPGAQWYQTRISASAPAVGAALAMMLAVMATRSRRLEHSARLHDGAALTDLTAIALVESVGWITPALLISTLTGFALVSSIPIDDRHSLQLSVLAITTATSLGAVLGCLVATATLRERQLFTYFKDRS